MEPLRGSSVWAGGSAHFSGAVLSGLVYSDPFDQNTCRSHFFLFSQRLLHNAIFYLCFQQLVELVRLKWLTFTILLGNKPARLNFLA